MMILRRKTRHILVEATSEINVDDKRVEESLRKELLNFMGEATYLKSSPQITAKLSGNVFIISTNRGYEKSIILAISFIKNLDNKRIGFYTIKTSGTIKSLKDYFAKTYGVKDR